MGNSFSNYVNSVAYGLRVNGYDVTELPYTDPVLGMWENLSLNLLPKLGWNAFLSREINLLIDRTYAACNNADLLLVIKGDLITLERLRFLYSQVKCPVVTWYMDSYKRVGEGIRRALLGNYLLFFEGTDAPDLIEAQVPCCQVDLSADPRWYYPLPSLRTRFELSFVSKLYATRLKNMEAIISRLKDQRIRFRILGSYIHRGRPWEVVHYARTYPNLFQGMRNVRHVPHSVINELNNQSLIALNILHEQSKDSLNMRAFEACASGTFQLIQKNAAIERCFVAGQEVETFESIEEAADKIRYYLYNEAKRKRIAAAGYARVMKDHTMPVRMGQITAHLKKVGFL